MESFDGYLKQIFKVWSRTPQAFHLTVKLEGNNVSCSLSPVETLSPWTRKSKKRKSPSKRRRDAQRYKNWHERIPLQTKPDAVGKATESGADTAAETDRTVISKAPAHKPELAGDPAESKTEPRTEFGKISGHPVIPNYTSSSVHRRRTPRRALLDTPPPLDQMQERGVESVEKVNTNPPSTIKPPQDNVMQHRQTLSKKKFHIS